MADLKLRIENLTRRHWSTGLGFAVLLGALGPGVIQESIWSDDAAFMYSARAGDGDTFGLSIAALRPSFAYLQAFLFEVAPLPPEAWVLRMLGLTSILVTFALLAHRWRGRNAPGFAIVIAAVCLCLPPFENLVHWSIGAPYLLGLPIGILSLLVWERRRFVSRLAAVLLFGLGISIYPPTTFFIFGLIAGEICLFAIRNKSGLQQVLGGAVLAAIGTGIGLGIGILGVEVFQVGVLERGSLVEISSIPNKLLWVAYSPAVAALRPFLVDRPSHVAVLMTAAPALIVVLLGLWWQARRLGDAFIGRAAIVAAALALSVTTLLTLRENVIEYRFFPGLAWGTAFILLFTICSAFVRTLDTTESRYGEVPASRLRGSVIALGIGCMVAVALLMNQLYAETVKIPYDLKTRYVARAMADCASHGEIREILLLKPLGPYPTRPRLGSYSMATDLSQEWTPVQSVSLMVAPQVKVSQVDREQVPVGASSPGVCILDWEPLRVQIAQWITEDS